MRRPWATAALALWAASASAASGLQYGDWVLVDDRKASQTIYAYTETADDKHLLGVSCTRGQLSIAFQPDEALKAKLKDVHMDISFNGREWSGIRGDLQLSPNHLRDLMSQDVFRARWTVDGQTVQITMSLKGAREAAVPVLQACGVRL